MVLEIILIAILFSYSLLASRLVYAQNKREAQYKEYLDFVNEYLEELEELITTADNIINVVDHRGHFRTDDEVETFFEALKEIRNKLVEFNISNATEIKEEE